MKQRGLVPIVIILLITVALVGYLIYSGKITLPQKQTIQTETSSVDETANWKTYTNNFDYYAVKYPDSWYLYPASAEGNGADLSDVELSSFWQIKSDDINHIRVNILAFKNPTQESLQEWLKNHNNEKVYSEEVINILGINGLKREESNSDFLQLGEIERATTSYIPYKDKVYRILIFPSNSNQKNISHQILSTFKFLDQNDNLSQADIDEIKQAVAQHEGQSLSEIKVNFDADINKYENFATGQVGPASGTGGGARWVAAKVNGKWVIVDIGQVGVTCDLAGKYTLPKQMVPKCIDGDNVVDR